MQRTDTEHTTFERIYQEHYAHVFRTCYDVLHHREESEDATQNVFLKAWLAFDTYKPTKDVRNWLYIIAQRTAIDVWRRKNKHVLVPIDEKLALFDSDVLILAEILADLQQHLPNLAKRERQAMELAPQYNGDYVGIAQELGISPTASKVALYHARKHLREIAS